MDCIVPGCENEARNRFSIRLRRPDTTAIWAPETGVHICDEHAVKGFNIDIIFRPVESGRILTAVSSTQGAPIRRSVRIKHSA